MALALPSLLFCLVLLVSPYLGCSYHTIYTHGGKHYAVRSLRGEDDNHGAAPAPARGPSPPRGAWVSIPVRGDPKEALPGAFQYHVVVGFGTPVQVVTVGFDTRTTGATLLKCTPCAATEPCDEAFEPSASSSLVQIPCGSPDCPFHGCSGPSCTLSISINNTLLGNATFVTDKLTLSGYATMDKFRFACLEAGFRPGDNSTGILDLSRNSHSLASRVPTFPGTVAFSYCLPSSARTAGFLSLGAIKPELSGRKVSYTPLRSNPGNGNLYVVDLVGVGLGGHDLSVPPTVLAGDTIVNLHRTFTYLRPEVYSALRDNFRQQMTEYKPAPPLGELDTCYNFTGRNFFAVPAVTLKFNGGADVVMSMNGMMYFPDPSNHFSIACLAFAALPTNAPEAAVIGSRAQSSMEVVYDVHGGKIGFVPYRC
ncbi:aspartyl protease family protein At5g10770-like [Panicum virgatum]|uniref:Peptidase A1 domain-containing protein n=1 Tax=Panicum virgatum TaxID=38727 RepID=A0A8T0T443_PANVG|nr:aspartyl protease family protein At5g10770-like [Panicum virgatum]KAG2605830.1 hypothetical protein PVAP13_4NG150781 [Panicum virgatum]